MVNLWRANSWMEGCASEGIICSLDRKVQGSPTWRDFFAILSIETYIIRFLIQSKRRVSYIYIYIIGDLIGNYLSIARMESSRNRNRIIDGEEKFRVESNEGYRIIPIPRKRILIFETVVETEFSGSYRYEIWPILSRSIDITRRPPSNNNQNGSVEVYGSHRTEPI